MARYQRGCVYRREWKGSKVWKGCYRVNEIQPDETVRRVHREVDLGSATEMSRKDARLALDKILLRVNTMPTRARMQFRQFVSGVWTRSFLPRLKPSTRLPYLDNANLHLIPFFGDYWMDEIKYSLIQNFVEEKRRHLSPRTVRNHKFLLQGILEEAQRHNLIEFNFAKLVEVGGRTGKQAPTVPLEMVEHVLIDLPEPYRTVALCGALLGLREGEIRGLKWADVDFEGRRIFVRRSIWRGHVTTPKTQESSTALPMPETIRQALTLHYARSQPLSQSSYVFLGRNKQPRNLDNARSRLLKPVLEKLGIWQQGMGWHAFRRTFCTQLQALGIDAKTLQTLARHTDAAITLNHYVQPIPRFQRQAMEMLDENCSRIVRGLYRLYRLYRLDGDWQAAYTESKQLNACAPVAQSG